jgi:hypothetical protein
MPSRSRIKSITANDSLPVPVIGSSRLTWTIEIAAANVTSMVVRKPTGRSASPRLIPIAALAIALNESRSVISHHSR